jgi:ferric-dicitrate binding protein FerR (iron transport regulator)
MVNSNQGADNQHQQAAFRIAYLVAGFLKGSLSLSEHKELDDWTNASVDNQRLFEKLTDPRQLESWKKFVEENPTDQAWERFQQKIQPRPAPRSILLRFSRWQVAAAAIILIALLGLTYWLTRPATTTTMPIAWASLATEQELAHYTNLETSLGQRINLDSLGTGTAAIKGASYISKNSATSIKVEATPAADFCRLSVWKGDYAVRLPDGSQVWLNSHSQLEFPTAFTDATRHVRLVGEGYFEIAKDPAHPFIVSSGNSTVRVLGTHFNVRAYATDSLLSITLAEGSVLVNDAATLTPGQQAQVSPQSAIRIQAADTSESLAWKNGWFQCKDMPLDQLMQRIGRYYDKEIIFKDPVRGHFNLTVPVSTTPEKVMELLAATGQLHAIVEPKSITIMK